MENNQDWEEQRNQIIGLGENSFKKSYYPELQLKISELEASYSNLNTIFNTINDGIVIHDEKGKIILLNNQSEKILNIKNEEKENFTIFDFSSPKLNSNDLLQIWAEVIEGKSQTIDWIVLQNKTGIEIPVQVSINKTIWYNNNAIVAAIRDNTDRKQFEDEIIEAKERAEENDRLKTAFLQNMSHEIRTPMNAISGFSSFLSDPDLTTDKRNDFVSIIQNSSNQLLSIVNDILTISSLETKQEKVNVQSVCVNSIVNNLFSIFSQQAATRNIALNHRQQLSDEQSTILTDETKVIQILTHLLSNAIKFTHSGSIEFGYHLINTDGNSFLQFYVIDTGIGINKKHHKTIFERFRQADTSINRKYGGTGLGLSISKAFVELLGGNIWLESESDKGSTFYFTIPYNHVEKTIPNEPQTISALSTETVIVAEDEEYNFRYIKELLKPFKFKILHAKNGIETVELSKANPEIKFILMDIKMPIMDGHTAAKLIKEFRPDLPIIAQSAYALENEINKFKSVFDEYITKPINMQQFNTIISKYK
ncbi:MAG: ATP-binding protein [Bacteroidales bacterium]